MIKRRGWHALLAGLLLLAGCAELMRNERAEEAKQRWGGVRAKVKLQLAQKSFDKGVIEDALKECNEAMRLDPGLTEAYLLAVRIRLERGEIGQAEATLESVRAIGPVTAEMSYLSGMIAERHGQSEQALGYYEEAYQVAPRELDYALTYAESLIAFDRYEDALVVLESRRADYEQEVAVHTLMAEAYWLSGKKIEAAECYRLAVNLAKENPTLLEEAGLAFLEAGWEDEAVEVLTSASRRRPTTQPSSLSPGEVSYGARGALAIALMRNAKPRQAVQVLERIVKERPEQPGLWMLTAEAYLRAGDVHRAGVSAQTALELAPDNEEARLLIAYHALEMDRPREAIKAAEELLEKNPNDLEARAILAQSLERDPATASKAMEHYRHILSVAPTHRWARLQLERLGPQAKADRLD